MRFTTDPRQARTVKMKDGTAYPVSARGTFVVTRDDHLAEMSRGNKESYASAVTFGGGGPSCDCLRTPWPWERECPRCGQPLQTS